MTLVRTSTHPALKEFCYLETRRPADFALMTPEKIVDKCKLLKNKWIFFGGDDPCSCDISPLFKTLHDAGFKVWLDTTGAFFINAAHVDYLSVGPKPGLPFNPLLIQSAQDVRLYWRDWDKEIWKDLFDKVLPLVPDSVPILIAPRVLTQSCVDSVIRFVLSREGTLPLVRADIPLFRTLPNFDKNFNHGIKCPMCHLMDKFQGVEVRSPLEPDPNIVGESKSKRRGR
jgi:organic radical activating enzyme